MAKTIKEMILENEIQALERVTNTSLIEFQDETTKANAYFFSCLSDNCNDQTIKYILDRTYKHFSEIVMDSEEMKKIKDSDDYNSDDATIIDQLGNIGNKFFNFFWGTITYHGIEMTAPALASIKKKEIVGYIKEKTNLSPLHDDLLKTKKIRLNIFSKLTIEHGNIAQNTYYSSKLGIVERPPRKFNGERERQLLKQFSTLLFFYIKKSAPTTPVETEVMHMRIGSVSHLIISCNASKDIDDSFNKIKNMQHLQSALTQDLEKNGTSEDKNRIERYREIFKKIFSNTNDVGFQIDADNNDPDIKYYAAILKILKNKGIQIKFIDNYQFDINNQQLIKDAGKIFNSKSSSIIVLNNKLAPNLESGCHAEEYLVDFRHAITSYKAKYAVGSTKIIYTAIAGKKRPCFTCYATMLNQYVDNYGQRPGYAWKSSLNSQSAENAKVTLLSMLSTPSHVTLDREGKKNSSYDSGSDDEEIKTQKKVYKL